eukprot:COSAG02_NODE_19_length_53976_cov_37.338512_47_plen_77_part_00
MRVTATEECGPCWSGDRSAVCADFAEGGLQHGRIQTSVGMSHESARALETRITASVALSAMCRVGGDDGLGERLAP